MPKGTPFPKGVSGNPSGRPRGVADLQAKCRKLTDKAVAALESALDDEDARVRVAAAAQLLDRGWGKATQPLSGPDGESLQIIINPLPPAPSSAT